MYKDLFIYVHIHSIEQPYTQYPEHNTLIFSLSCLITTVASAVLQSEMAAAFSRPKMSAESAKLLWRYPWHTSNLVCLKRFAMIISASCRKKFSFISAAHMQSIKLMSWQHHTLCSYHAFIEIFRSIATLLNPFLKYNHHPLHTHPHCSSDLGLKRMLKMRHR